MPNLRDRIRMTDAEVAAFLDGSHKLQLATINRDGTPHLATMYYALVDGHVAFWTYHTSQKARNLERDARATGLVEAGEGYDELHGVTITGRAVAVPKEQVRAVGFAVYRRYVPEVTVAFEEHIDRQAPKRNAYLLEPERVVSWDHRKLATAS